LIFADQSFEVGMN